MRLSDYDKIPCSAKEAHAWLTDKGYCTNSGPTAIIYRRNNLCAHLEYEDVYGAWVKSSYSDRDLMSYDWFKLVPKKPLEKLVDESQRMGLYDHHFSDKPDRFRLVDRLIDGLTENECMRIKLGQLARAIIDLVEKGK